MAEQVLSRYEVLRRQPYFQELDEAAVKAVAARLRGLRVARGQILFLQGDQGVGVHFVAAGQVKIYKTAPDGRQQVMFVAGPGVSFADVPAFDGGPAPASAEAIEPSVVYTLSRPDLLAVLREHPLFALSVIGVLAARLRHMTGLIEDLSFRHVPARVALLLLRSTGERGSGVLEMTQEEIASVVGTAREVAGRALKQLAGEGAIRVERGRVVVLDPVALRRRVESDGN